MTVLAQFEVGEAGWSSPGQALQLLGCWSHSLPGKLLAYSGCNRQELLERIDIAVDRDEISYLLNDREIDALTAATLGDNLTAFARGWCLGFGYRDSNLRESWLDESEDWTEDEI